MGIFHSYVELRLPFFMGATSPAALPQAAQVLLSRANSSLLWIAIALALIACCWSSLAGKNHGKPGFDTNHGELVRKTMGKASENTGLRNLQQIYGGSNGFLATLTHKKPAFENQTAGIPVEHLITGYPWVPCAIQIGWSLCLDLLPSHTG